MPTSRHKAGHVKAFVGLFNAFVLVASESLSKKGRVAFREFLDRLY